MDGTTRGRARDTHTVAWQMASAVRAKRRANFEAGREDVRVVLRAWREAADTVRAGAAKWAIITGTRQRRSIDHHWQRACTSQCPRSGQAVSPGMPECCWHGCD